MSDIQPGEAEALSEELEALNRQAKVLNHRRNQIDARLLADKMIESMPNGDGTFMGIYLREFSKKQLIKIMCVDHAAFVREMTKARTGVKAESKPATSANAGNGVYSTHGKD